MVELAGHPLVTIGAHGHWHAQLPVLTAAELDTDIDTCLDQLREHVQQPVTVFAYPHGATNRAVIERLSTKGFAWAAGTDSRPLSVLDSRWNLPRIATADIDGAEFVRRRRLA